MVNVLGVQLYGLPIGDGSRPCVSVEPADPVDGADMVSVTVAVGEISIRAVVNAVYLVEMLSKAAGLGEVGPFLDARGVAERIGRSYESVRRMKMLGELPPADHRIGNMDLWRPGTIVLWQLSEQNC